mmetsp:Transcript_4267/g.13784  ORF Transcript_4267/g.13784 Transcript_4267/m.13784 type:complete len:225 (+) Transcript_4267:1984-2658(+)
MLAAASLTTLSPANSQPTQLLWWCMRHGWKMAPSCSPRSLVPAWNSTVPRTMGPSTRITSCPWFIATGVPGVPVTNDSNMSGNTTSVRFLPSTDMANESFHDSCTSRKLAAWNMPTARNVWFVASRSRISGKMAFVLSGDARYHARAGDMRCTWSGDGRCFHSRISSSRSSISSSLTRSRPSSASSSFSSPRRATDRSCEKPHEKLCGPDCACRTRLHCISYGT